MDSTNTKVSLLEGQSSKPTKPQKPLIIIVFFSFIILLALIIGALSTAQFVKISNQTNPDKSIRAICSVTQYIYSCFETLSSITKNTTTTTTSIQTNPELIITLFLKLAIQELSNLTSLPKTQISESTYPRSESMIRECMTGFSSTLSQLNRFLASMHVDQGEKTLTEEKINDMKRLISAAVADQERCFYRYEAMDLMVSYEARAKAQRTMQCMSNILAILSNIETIRDRLNPLKRLLEFGFRVCV